MIMASHNWFQSKGGADDSSKRSRYPRSCDYNRQATALPFSTQRWMRVSRTRAPYLMSLCVGGIALHAQGAMETRPVRRGQCFTCKARKREIQEAAYVVSYALKVIRP